MAIRRIEGLLHLASEGRYAVVLIVLWLSICLMAQLTH